MYTFVSCVLVAFLILPIVTLADSPTTTHSRATITRSSEPVRQDRSVERTADTATDQTEGGGVSVHVTYDSTDDALDVDYHVTGNTDNTDISVTVNGQSVVESGDQTADAGEPGADGNDGQNGDSDNSDETDNTDSTSPDNTTTDPRTDRPDRNSDARPSR